MLWGRILGASLLLGPCQGAVAMSVSGDPSDGSYTISWTSGSTYKYEYRYDGYDYYELYERVDGGSWATNSAWLNVSSVSFTGKAAGTYEYKLTWRTQTCISGETGVSDPYVHNGVAEQITVTVPAPDLTPTFGTSTVSAKTWKAGTAISGFTVPAATGGDGTLAYSETGLPDGVDMSTTTRAVSGTPTAAGNGTATITATDSDGDTATLSFTWTVTAPVIPPLLSERSDNRGYGNLMVMGT